MYVTDVTFLVTQYTLRVSVTSDHPMPRDVGVNIFGFLTSSLEPLHGFASKFVWMFLGWTPTMFVKIGVLPLFFMELWVILCNFLPILKKIFYKTIDQKSSIFGLESPKGV